MQNPTTFFFEQANSPPDNFRNEINDFVKKLINLQQCVICKEDYNFTDKLPRILIHCGHTFCNSCLQNFYQNQKVRCPICLKLIKNIETLDRLPVNHTIFTKMAEQLNEQNRRNGQEQVDIPAALYAQFEASLQPQQQNNQYQQQQQQQNFNQNGDQQQQGVRIDEETGLEWCEYHFDRVKHFFCMAHQQTACRVCSEVLHSKNQCSIVDLYEIEDMHGFLKNFPTIQAGQQQQENGSQQQQLTPQQQQMLQQQQGTINSNQKVQNKTQNGQNGDQDADDDEDYEDDDDDEEEEDDDDDDEDDDGEDDDDENNNQEGENSPKSI